MVAAATKMLAALLACAAATVATGGVNHQQQDDDAGFIFFIKAPTSPAFRNVTWLQQSPDAFSEESFRTFMDALGGPPTTNPKMKVGLTFQWELLDCFLSPHSCTPAQVAQGLTAFLDAAVATSVPVQITLDTVQFWYQSNLWNWWDPTQPGYDRRNVANVEWTGWDPANATLIAWRNWGSQFRMPTPQPNLASPALLNFTGAALASAIGAIRSWYEAATPAARKLLVSIKLGEEVDVGANFYYYPGGNEIFRANPSNASLDPKAGPQWGKGLAGGLQPQGYNMLKTLGLRSSGGPPTRSEITKGIRHYFTSVIGSCVSAWPALAQNGLLATHGGACGDPLLIEWNSPMTPPATPGYSFYLSPHCFNVSCFQPGLRTALESYDPGAGLKKGRFVVAESACFGCTGAAEWEGYFNAAFNNSAGEVHYLRYYNIEPFLAAPGSVEGLRNFVNGWRETPASTARQAAMKTDDHASAAAAAAAAAAWTVTAHKLDKPGQGFPAYDASFCKATDSCTNASEFDATFNPTYLKLPTGEDALIMRAQMARSKCGTACAQASICANTSCADHLVLGRYNCSGGDGPGTGAEVAARMRCSHEPLTAAHSVVMSPSSISEQCGLLDPRATWDPVTKRFFMSYWGYGDCPEAAPRPKGTDDMLLATSADGVQWQRRGELYGRRSAVSPGVYLYRNPAAGKRHLLFYMATWDQISVVDTVDAELLRWNMSVPTAIANSRGAPATAWNSTDPRGWFDNAHMEPAVAVELKKSGLILLIYTTVSTNGWSKQHNLTCTTPPFVECWMPGYLLVDCGATADSCKVVQRSSEPLLLPTLPWELAGACTGMGTSDALQRLESPGPGERFLLHYDAADMRVGAAVISVEPAAPR